MRLVLDAVEDRVAQAGSSGQRRRFSVDGTGVNGFEVGGQEWRGGARMNITLYIERLVFDGLSIASGEAAFVQAAVEAELRRLLANELFAPPRHSQKRASPRERFMFIPARLRATWAWKLAGVSFAV